MDFIYIERCHKDRLEELLPFLQPEMFKELCLEPLSWENFAITCREMHPNASRQDLNDLFRFELEGYRYNNDIDTCLYDYGDDREEIVRNFGEHVLNCVDCNPRYYNFLLEENYGNANQSIYEIDNSYLKIMPRSEDAA